MAGGQDDIPCLRDGIFVRARQVHTSAATAKGCLMSVSVSLIQAVNLTDQCYSATAQFFSAIANVTHYLQQTTSTLSWFLSFSSIWTSCGTGLLYKTCETSNHIMYTVHIFGGNIAPPSNPEWITVIFHCFQDKCRSSFIKMTFLL